MPGRFYVTTPIYYVNDAPHIGHAYTTVTADAVARWHRLLGEETLFLTGTDEHGLKVQRAAEENGQEPLGLGRPDHGPVRRGVGAARHLQRRLHPHHRAPAPPGGAGAAHPHQGQRLDLPGHLRRLVLRGLRGVLRGVRPRRGQRCPIHGRPVEWFEEENWFFKLSAFEDRLTEWLTQDPSPVKPDGKRNEALGIVRQGLEDVSISRSSIDWGVPVPWDPDHVFYVWYDALINYATAAGFGSDEAAFEQWWPEVHHLIGKDIIRFHCVYWPAMLMAADLAPPKSVHVHGFLLVGGEKMSKTKLNQITPAELVEDFGVDGFRHHFLHDQPFGPDGDFSYEGMVARYNADLANNLGNLLSRVATVVDKKCGGIGPAPDPDSPLAPIAAEAYAETAAAWDRVQPSVALDATWRLIRETNAHLEANEPWKMEAGPEVDRIMGDALEALRIVDDPRLPGRTGFVPRDLAPHRAAGHARGPAPPRRCDVGAVPRRPAGREGRRRSSRASRPDVGAELRWTDDHCHLPDDGTAEDVLGVRPGRRRGALRPRRHRRRRRRGPALALAASHDGVWATAGVHPHEARHGIDGLEALLADPWCVAVGECGFDFHYDHSPRDVQRDVFAAQIALAHAHDKALVIHTREAWEETFEVLDAEGIPDRTVFHCFTGGADEADECLARGAFLSFSGIVDLPQGRRRAGRRRPVPARPDARGDRQPVPGAGAQPGPTQPAGVGAARRRGRRGGLRPHPRRRRRGHLAQRRPLLPARLSGGSGTQRAIKVAVRSQVPYRRPVRRGGEPWRTTTPHRPIGGACGSRSRRRWSPCRSCCSTT